MRRLGCTVYALVFLVACQRPRDPLTGFPRVVLWAWERPDDLRFIDPERTGIAFLARTIEWRDGRLNARPRLQTLHFPTTTVLMAVVRMESFSPPLPEAAEVAAEITRAGRLPGVRALQVDFDARRSEREWYADVIRRVRSAIGPRMPLSITALASWCEGDPWIRDLPVDDAVPMLFRMGPGEHWTGRDFSIAMCRSSIGLSTDELPASLPTGLRGRRLFVFHPAAWSAESYRGVNQVARRWR
jgi:hypothetical protein